MGIFEKLQARTSYPSPHRTFQEHEMTRYRSRALPPRTALHSPREAHHLLQRRAIRRWRIRLHISTQLGQLIINEEQQAIQQDADDRNQGAEARRKWPIINRRERTQDAKRTTLTLLASGEEVGE